MLLWNYCNFLAVAVNRLLTVFNVDRSCCSDNSDCLPTIVNYTIVHITFVLGVLKINQFNSNCCPCK